jgi:hypothetical protein
VKDNPLKSIPGSLIDSRLVQVSSFVVFRSGRLSKRMESVGLLRLTLTFEFRRRKRSDFRMEREKLRYASYIEFFRIFGDTRRKPGANGFRAGRNPRERCVRGDSFAMTWSSLFLFLFVLLFSPPRSATGSRACTRCENENRISRRIAFRLFPSSLSFPSAPFRIVRR